MRFRSARNEASRRLAARTAGFSLMLWALLWTAALALALSGCAAGPDFERPAPPSAQRYTADETLPPTVPADGVAQQFRQGGGPAADWWRQFGSAQIDAAMSEAFAGNPSLEAAQASLRRSQDNLRAGYGVFLPGADAAAGVSRQQYSPQRVGQQLPPSIFNLFTLSASASYALDLFGGERRAVEGLQADVDLQRNVLRAAYLTLSANVVNTMVAAAAYRAEIEAERDTIDELDEQVRLAQVQERAGTGTAAAVLALQGERASEQAVLPALQQKLDQTGHLLATLAGQAPAEWRPPQAALADLRLPSDIPLSLPSELVRRRPDILQAEAQLHAASAAVGVATAAMLPSIDLSASYGGESSDAGKLFDSGSRVWSVGAGLTAPLFEGGTLWFQRRAAQEAYQAALAGYRQTVLAAFGQVADAMRALVHDAEALSAQAARYDSTRQARRLAQANYDAGLSGYLEVLSADIALRQAQTAYLEARAQRFQDTVALFVALGGGWDEGTATPPPAAAEAAGTGAAAAP